MNSSVLNMRASYVFNALAIILAGISIVLYFYFEATKEKISTVNNEANLEYVESLADNLIKDIIRVSEEDFLTELQEDEILKSYVESDLKLFVTTKYQYIYLLSKDDRIKDGFRILVDSSRNLDEKNSLYSLYNSLAKDNFSKVYRSQKSLYLKDNKRGATYLKPIIIANKVKAIIVVEFSLQEQNAIALELQTLANMFQVAITFFIIIFIFMLWFSYIDARREKEKKVVLEKLKASNRNLEIETAKVKDLNDSLADKVKLEVNKNREKDAQMIQQSRLAQMGEMISMIAHQWRQPLAAISSTSSAINIKAQLGNLENEKVIALTKKINEYSQHLSTTIDDFRDFFKSNKETKETNYSELIKSVLGIIEDSLINKNIELIQDLKIEDTIKTYPNEIKQVILNLIKNAEDVLIEKQIINPYIKIMTYKEGENLVLSVSDNGGGIPKEIRDKIFDPYFSTKIKKNGTGLGLYMSKTIVEKHCGGKLTVANSDEGAVFKILLDKN